MALQKHAIPRGRFGGREIWEAKRLRELEAENARPVCLLVEAELEKEAMKEVIAEIPGKAGVRPP